MSGKRVGICKRKKSEICNNTPKHCRRKMKCPVFCIYKIGIYVKYKEYILYIKYIGFLFVIKIINSNFSKNSMNKAINKVNYTTKEYISEIYEIWQK